MAAIVPPFGFLQIRNLTKEHYMDELFNIIGRLYVDIYNSQRLMDVLQDQLKNKDKEIGDLKKQLKNE